MQTPAVKPIPELSEVLSELGKITDPEILRKICIATFTDMKTMKDCLLQAADLFGLAEDGKFVSDPKMKDVMGSVTKYAAKAMNPFAKNELAADFAFFAQMAPLGEKYQNL
jgi:hypothetical protein